MAGSDDVIFSGGFLLIIGIIIFIFGFKAMNRYRIISDIPTSKIRSMAMGIVEINGNIAETVGKLLETPISKAKCVYYNFIVKEYRCRSSGKNGRSCSWETIYSDNNSVPFYVKDDTGSVCVLPKGAEFDFPAKKVFSAKGGLIGGIKTLTDLFKAAKEVKTEGITDDEEMKRRMEKKTKSKIDFSRLNITEIDPKIKIRFATTGDKRFYEYYLEPNEHIYVMGTAVNDIKYKNNVVIKKGENEKTFLISNKSEEVLLKSFKKRMLTSFIFGGSAILGGSYLLLTLVL